MIVEGSDVRGGPRRSGMRSARSLRRPARCVSSVAAEEVRLTRGNSQGDTARRDRTDPIGGADVCGAVHGASVPRSRGTLGFVRPRRSSLVASALACRARTAASRLHCRPQTAKARVAARAGSIAHRTCRLDVDATTTTRESVDCEVRYPCRSDSEGGLANDLGVVRVDQYRAARGVCQRHRGGSTKAPEVDQF